MTFLLKLTILSVAEEIMTYGSRTDHYPAISKLLQAGCMFRPHHSAVGDCDVQRQRRTDTGHTLQFSQVARRPDPDPDDFAPNQSACPWRACCGNRRALAEGRFVNRTHLALCAAARHANRGLHRYSAFVAPTPFFGLFNLPPMIGKNEALATQLFTLHRWAG